jgi:hypothetical protein
MDTKDLIERLAADLKPVRPLWPPWARTVLWMGIALPYVAAVVWGKLTMVDPVQVVNDTRFMIEQAATLATAATAAIAAFRSAVPGFDMRVLLLPVAPLGLWLASVGHGCIQDWLQLGAEGLTIRRTGLPALATVIGIIPAAAMIVMLRRHRCTASAWLWRLSPSPQLPTSACSSLMPAMPASWFWSGTWVPPRCSPHWVVGWGNVSWAGRQARFRRAERGTRPILAATLVLVLM